MSDPSRAGRRGSRGRTAMMSLMTPNVLLWDFGNTLADERWMRAAPAGCPGWEAAWLAVMAEAGVRWNLGEMTANEIFAALSKRTGLARDRVEAHAHECCKNLVFNKAAWGLARQHRLPQALVTVNPDLFGSFVVPTYKLAEVFDAIVVSFAEGTDDKSELCDIAVVRLHFKGPRSSALLIDNRQDSVEGWRKGGVRDISSGATPSSGWIYRFFLATPATDWSERLISAHCISHLRLTVPHDRTLMPMSVRYLRP
jgi:hypothetical protein